MKSQAAFACSAVEIRDLEKTLSFERFGAYVQIAKGDRAIALKLYERNTYLSESLYGLVQGFEIPFRNSIDLLLSTAYGENWYSTIAMEFAQRSQVAEAKDKLRKSNSAVSHGRVIAQLTLGFWTALIGRRYEHTLWTQHLHRSFPYALEKLTLTTGEKRIVRLRRNEISKRVDAIKTLRNRIAHHECILRLALPEAYNDILDAIGWLCPTTASWVSNCNSFRERYDRSLPSLPSVSQPRS